MVLWGKAQVAERLEQAAAFGHPRGQDHQLAPLAHEPAVQAEATDHLQRGRLVGGGTGDQHLPVAMSDTTRAQRIAHGLIDRGDQLTDADGVEQHRAVLGDDSIDAVIDLWEHGAELAHDPPGDHDHPDPSGTCFVKRGQRVGRDLTLGQGAVEVDRHRPEVEPRFDGCHRRPPRSLRANAPRRTCYPDCRDLTLHGDQAARPTDDPPRLGVVMTRDANVASTATLLQQSRCGRNARAACDPR
jgi:hypothetical protein